MAQVFPIYKILGITKNPYDEFIEKRELKQQYNTIETMLDALLKRRILEDNLIRNKKHNKKPLPSPNSTRLLKLLLENGNLIDDNLDIYNEISACSKFDLVSAKEVARNLFNYKIEKSKDCSKNVKEVKEFIEGYFDNTGYKLILDIQDLVTLTEIFYKNKRNMEFQNTVEHLIKAETPEEIFDWLLMIKYDEKKENSFIVNKNEIAIIFIFVKEICQQEGSDDQLFLTTRVIPQLTNFFQKTLQGNYFLFSHTKKEKEENQAKARDFYDEYIHTSLSPTQIIRAHKAINNTASIYERQNNKKRIFRGCGIKIKENYLLTCYHVCGTKNPDRLYNNLYVRFGPSNAAPEIKLKNNPKHYDKELDYVIIELGTEETSYQEDDEEVSLNLQTFFYQGNNTGNQAQFFIIVHRPRGSAMTTTLLYNNYIEDYRRYNDAFSFYYDVLEMDFVAGIAPGAGSSGAPIFDSDWQLVGLHRRSKEAAIPEKSYSGIMYNEIYKKLFSQYYEQD